MLDRAQREDRPDGDPQGGVDTIHTAGTLEGDIGQGWAWLSLRWGTRKRKCNMGRVRWIVPACTMDG
jgi:hypothetical protein